MIKEQLFKKFYSWLVNKNDIKIKEEQEIVLKKEIDFSSFEKITSFLYEKSGITDLHKRVLSSSLLQQYAIKEGICTTEELLEKLKTEKTFYQEVINIVTVNESFFMRELKELEWLVEYIKQSTTKLSILSIPSSTGEEVYSILMLMLENGIALNKISLYGYDISSQAVAKAKIGVYDEHSVHKLTPELREKYFIKDANAHYEILPMIKNSVVFEQKNIFELSSSQNRYDVILSRNMFIYFDDKKREEALHIITNMLKYDGIYIKGHADYIKNHLNLERISYRIHKKRSL